jgi:hypothetical protein
VTSKGRSQALSRYLIRLALFGALAVVCALAVTDGAYVMGALLGIGAAFAGRPLLDLKGIRRKELWRSARENARELGRVAREDRIATQQMKRLEGLQAGLLESWELLPEGYRPLLDEDIITIVEEIADTARLARRRAALRRHLDSVDRREISRRIVSLERDLAELEDGSALRQPLESALSGRQEELTSCKDMLDGIAMIDAQLENTESLLSNLSGELLALDTSLSPGSMEPGLAQLKSRVAYFRQSMDEVRRSVEALPPATTEGLPGR